MNKEREENYRHLICSLLTYPNRAALMLDANQHLLDAGLMQHMEQVATRMAANSSIEAASFLQNLVAQLKDELTTVVVKKASLLEGQGRIIEEVDGECEYSKWGGLALIIGNILFVLIAVI